MWRKSSFSNPSGNSVEVDTSEEGKVKVRDSKLGDQSPVLVFDHAEWDAFIRGVKVGDFDLAEV